MLRLNVAPFDIAPPRPGDPVAPELRARLRRVVGPIAPGTLVALTPEQEEANAREQEAIARAVEGVVP
jgi:hypothetical protein